MKITAALVILIVLVCPTQSQNAKVVALDAADSMRGERAYKDMLEAQEKWKEYQKYVERKYVREGWKNGFDFTGDFKYIVPKPFESSPSRYNGLNCLEVR